VTNATNITIDQGVGTVSAKGTTEVSLEETTTYTLTATNSDGQKTASCKVVILNLPVIEYFTASPESIIQGEWSELSWSVQPEGLTEALRIEPLGNLTIPFEGSLMVYSTETTTYTLIAVNSDGQTEASCTIHVIPNYQGTWTGTYIVSACDPINGYSPIYISPGTEMPINLVLTQNEDQVIGSFYVGHLTDGDAEGSIAVDGQLSLTGFKEADIWRIDATLQLQSATPGQITGTLVWILVSSSPEGGTQISGTIYTLNRTAP